MTYNTKQKEKILEVIKHQDGDFTINDIYNKLKDVCGLTTIYRLIDKLEEEKMIKRFLIKDKVYYQYLEKCEEENHFYLKCVLCKSMIHIDCDCIKELSEHIRNKHKFSVSKENIIINGICNKCMCGEKNE